MHLQLAWQVGNPWCRSERERHGPGADRLGDPEAAAKPRRCEIDERDLCVSRRFVPGGERSAGGELDVLAGEPTAKRGVILSHLKTFEVVARGRCWVRGPVRDRLAPQE